MKERQSMPLYEHVFLARQDISAQQVEGLLQTFRSLIEEQGGSVGKTEYWGIRSLSYRIKKNRKAHFSLMNVTAPHEAIAELERQMRLSTDVIRFLTVRVDEHDETPSPVMRRSDRDDRDGRRGPRREFRDRDQAPRETPRETPPEAKAATEAKSEPAKSEPAKTEPDKTEPAKTESAKAEPAKTEPAKTESAKAEPAKTESAKTESAKAEPAKTDQEESA